MNKLKNKGTMKIISILSAFVLVLIVIGNFDYEEKSKSNISIKGRSENYNTEYNKENDGVRVKTEYTGELIKVLPVPDISKEVIINKL